jgi:hypothetical protein
MEGSFSLTVDAEGSLTKAATVLRGHSTNGPVVTFAGERSDGTVWATFSEELFEELGRPGEITVTIESGNTLPEEQPAAVETLSD